MCELYTSGLYARKQMCHSFRESIVHYKESVYFCSAAEGGLSVPGVAAHLFKQILSGTMLCGISACFDTEMIPFVYPSSRRRILPSLPVDKPYSF